MEKIYIVEYPKKQERKEIDLKLLRQFKEFLSKEYIITNQSLQEDFLTRVDDLLHFLENFPKGVKINLKYPRTELREEYQKRSKDFLLDIEIIEKQRNAKDMLEQIFISVDPFKLAQTYRTHFDRLLRFQEASFKYQSNYRDHLIHSLRVFLSIIAIFDFLGDKWIIIFRNFLHNQLQELNLQIDPDTLVDEVLWKLSVDGALIMSLFHDIGTVPSEFVEMINGLKEYILGDSKEQNGLLLIDFSFEEKFSSDFENRIEEILKIYEKIGDLHPHYHEKLKEDFEDLRNQLKEGVPMKDLHGSLSFVYLFPASYINGLSTLGSSDFSSRYSFDESHANEKGFPSLSDSTYNEWNENMKKDLGPLILYEALIAIFVHDKKEYFSISPFSEILIFSDNSQEWDRIESEQGKITRYEKDRVEIFKYRCDAGVEGFGFSEESKFGANRKLEGIVGQYKDSFSDETSKGIFSFFISIVANKESEYVNKPSQAIFRCKHMPKLNSFRDVESREKIELRDFCSACALARGLKVDK